MTAEDVLHRPVTMARSQAPGGVAALAQLGFHTMDTCTKLRVYAEVVGHGLRSDALRPQKYSAIRRTNGA